MKKISITKILIIISVIIIILGVIIGFGVSNSIENIIPNNWLITIYLNP